MREIREVKATKQLTSKNIEGSCPLCTKKLGSCKYQMLIINKGFPIGFTGRIRSLCFSTPPLLCELLNGTKEHAYH